MADPSESAIRELQIQYPRVENLAAAARMWERILSSADRDTLGGDLATAYQDGGTIGMWVRLHGGTGERAVIDVAYSLNFISAESREWFLREFGEPTLPSSTSPTTQKPVWDSSRGVLLLNGEQIRNVDIRATKTAIQKILDAFQAAGWPPSIPQPFNSNVDQNELSQLVHRLNERLKKILFRCQAGGSEIVWELQP